MFLSHERLTVNVKKSEKTPEKPANILNMLRALTNKILQAVATLIAIMTLSFFVMEMAPGGPLSQQRRLPGSVMVGRYISQGIGRALKTKRPCEVKKITPTGTYLKKGEAVITCKGHVISAPTPGRLLAVNARQKEKLLPGQLIAAIGRPMGIRYLKMLAHMAVFDFGTSYESNGTRSVREIIVKAAPVTAMIGIIALVLALILGFISGLFAAWSFWTDYTLTTLSTLILAIPMVVAAPMALYIFSVATGLLPIGWDGTIAGAILPVVTLSSIYWAVFHRVVLTTVREFFNSEIFTSLLAKGLRTRVLVLHILRHTALGVAGLLGPIAASLLTGSVVVEEVFHVPGLARFFVNSALGRDFPVLLGVVYFYALLLVILNMSSDLLVYFLDPRTRRSR